METQDIKQEAHRLLDDGPHAAAWDDLMYRIYVRQAIEVGIKHSDADRAADVKEVCKKSGLPATY